MPWRRLPILKHFIKLVAFYPDSWVMLGLKLCLVLVLWLPTHIHPRSSPSGESLFTPFHIQGQCYVASEYLTSSACLWQVGCLKSWQVLCKHRRTMRVIHLIWILGVQLGAHNLFLEMLSRGYLQMIDEVRQIPPEMSRVGGHLVELFDGDLLCWKTPRWSQ